jgi:hypothetical protein
VHFSSMKECKLFCVNTMPDSLLLIMHSCLLLRLLSNFVPHTSVATIYHVVSRFFCTLPAFSTGGTFHRNHALSQSCLLSQFLPALLGPFRPYLANAGPPISILHSLKPREGFLYASAVIGCGALLLPRAPGRRYWVKLPLVFY